MAMWIPQVWPDTEIMLASMGNAGIRAILIWVPGVATRAMVMSRPELLQRAMSQSKVWGVC